MVGAAGPSVVFNVVVLYQRARWGDRLVGEGRRQRGGEPAWEYEGGCYGGESKDRRMQSR
jgi:hypothetical protein